MTQKIILTRGIPASGKTTWAEGFVKGNPDFVNINRDDLRTMLFPFHYGKGVYKPNKSREQAVTDAQLAIARNAIEDGESVIVSDTNLREDTRNKWHELADSFEVANVEVEIKDFDCDLDTALERNALRDGGVPPKVIYDMYEQYMEQVHLGWKVKPDSSLPVAIIVDVDGTLANHEGVRSPYDWKSVGRDNPHEDIIDLVRRYSADHTVIIMTGRDGEARKDTVKWLDRHGVPFDEIFIRAAGDTRKDSIIKRELFDKHVRGRYNVKFVIDDRLQVIYMWRALGLKVLDVAGGAF